MTKTKVATQSSLDELLEQFEALSSEERERDVAEASEFLKVNGVKNLDDFDKLMRSQ